MTTAADVIRVAETWIGYRDADGRKVWAGVGLPSWSGSAWCAAWVQLIFQQLGIRDQIDAISDYWCPSLEDFARSRGTWVDSDVSWTAKPGDVVLFDWDVDGKNDHVGIVTAIGPGWVKTIEGNTSDADWSNGGTVARQTRYPSQVRGFISIIYGAPSAPSVQEGDDMALLDEIIKLRNEAQAQANSLSARQDVMARAEVAKLDGDNALARRLCARAADPTLIAKGELLELLK